MPTRIETQIKAHWAKVVFAIAAASITVITKTGEAVATRVSDLVFKTESNNLMIDVCKKQDSAIRAMHEKDMSIITESIDEIKESYSQIEKLSTALEKKIDMQSAKIDGYFEGLNLRFSANDSTRPCNYIEKPYSEAQITSYYK
jgi:hypothetical protein